MKPPSLLILSLAIHLASAQGTASLQSAVDRALKPSAIRGVPSAFEEIHASVRDGIVTLTGSAGLYSTRVQAEAEVSRIKGVLAIRDNIQVGGPAVSDLVLKSNLDRRMRHKAISVAVHNGVVELTGEHVDPVSASAAFATAANTPGVQAIVNHMAVTPWGPEVGSLPGTISSLP